VFDDPPASDSRPLIAPFQQKVYRVALPIGVTPPNLRVCLLYGSEEVQAQLLCISGRDAQCRREEPRLVPPLVVEGVEAIVTELVHIDNCAAGMRDGHTLRARPTQYRRP
jgi:hypothetical protein